MNNPLIKIDNINIEQQISDKSQEEVIKALKIALEPFGIAMAMISDRLTLWRMSNLIKITDKAKTMLVGKGLKAEAVEKKFLSGFIEESSHEDDPDLQEMWARLLINESINSDPANITYINTLKNLNPDSAKLLKMVWQSAKDKGYDYFEAVIDNHTQDATWSELDLGKNETMAQRKDAMQISFSSSGKMNNVFFQNNMKILIHLKNQGLIDIITTIGETLTGQDNSFSVWAIISPYGYDFVSTCETIKENEGQNENQ